MDKYGGNAIGGTISPDFSASSKDAIRTELDRILASRHFKSSKRCPLFLQFVVERTLLEDTDRIKERTLGVEVFGRSSNYVTADDPVVRVTAGEVRKRLARYYQDSVWENQVQIHLPVGSYIPEFKTTSSSPPLGVEESELPLESPPSDCLPTPLALEESTQPVAAKRSWFHLAYGATIVVLLAGLVTLLYQRSNSAQATTETPSLDLLWKPILDFSGTLNVYAEAINASPEDGRLSLDQLPIADFETKAQLVPESTAFAGMATFTYLMGHKKHFVVREGRKADFQSFQNGPSVILGMANDFWVKKAVEQMRYRFVSDDRGTVSIQDSQTPGTALASVNTQASYGAAADDYAIIGRVRDHDSNHWFLVATGIGDAGMFAAGRFLRNPQYSRSLLDVARRQWGGDNNVEIILSSHVINGVGGPPQIVKTLAW